MIGVTLFRTATNYTGLSFSRRRQLLQFLDTVYTRWPQPQELVVYTIVKGQMRPEVCRSLGSFKAGVDTPKDAEHLPGSGLEAMVAQGAAQGQ